MKKLFVLLLTLSLMVGAFCITAVTSSAEDSDTVVMTVSGMTENGSKILTERYYNFESAWNDAARYSKDKEWMQQNGVVCIVVDLNADWVAEKGKFGEDNVGFKESTIYVPENAKIMINMQGHTIDRGLTKVKDRGEVIHVGKNATLVINGGYIKDDIVEIGKSELNKDKMGTITGGFSDNAAGGIHLDGNNNLVLNNVHVDGNAVDGEHGAAIALYDNSTLVMNGGSISDNYLIYDYFFFFVTIDYDPYGSLYVKNSTATLNNVEICGNHSDLNCARGTAIYATENSNVTMKNCLVKDNASKEHESAEIICAEDSILNITNTDFIDNGLAVSMNKGYDANTFLFYLIDCEMYLTDGKITGNSPDLLFRIKDSDVEMKNITITDNSSWVMHVDNEENQKVKMIDCTLNNNLYVGDIHAYANVDIEVKNKNTLEFEGGDLGDTIFEDKSMVVGVGSMIGEGSFNNILIILSLLCSAFSICLTVVFYKKRSGFVVANGAPEADEDDE